MDTTHYLGAGIILLIITAAGIWSGKKVKSPKDFTTGGRKAGAGIVAGSIIGSLVGGASTIGTAQLAYASGFSAWWFTLGGGLGCLIMACFFVKPLYTSGISTLPEVFAREYGRPAATVATLLMSAGNFLTIAAQVLSGVALITVISSISELPAALITAALMLVYVIFGGVWGAGIVGIVKTVLLYLGIGFCGVLALKLQCGVSGFFTALDAGQYFNLFSRGIAVDLGSGLSLILGVLTTQAYIQAVVSAKSLRLSRAGVLSCAVMIPVIGVAGIFIGMYMKINYPDIASSSALPMFILEHTSPLLAGTILATLLVTLVGTGAGISLGLSSMVTNDIYKVYVNKNADDKKTLFVTRLVIAAILAAAVLLTYSNVGSTILSWSFLSMGLRGAVGFAPLFAALFLPGRVPQRYVIVSMCAAIAGLFAGQALLPDAIDPLFLGLGLSILIMGVGIIAGRKGGSHTWLVSGKIRFIQRKTQPVIAIDEQYGSGAYEIGSALAAQLNIPCYGLRELIGKASEISGVEARLLEQYAERNVRAAYDFGAVRGSVRLPPAGDFVTAMRLATRHFIDAGPCVLVSSLACCIYGEDADVLKVYVHKSMRARVQALTDSGGAIVSPAKLLRKVDRQRRRYYRSISKAWGDTSSYHLAIYASNLTADETSRHITEYLSDKKSSRQTA